MTTMTRWALGTLGLTLVLGCSGLMGYGTELGSTPITSGEDFSMQFTTANAEAHNVWLEYQVSYHFDYEITGDFKASIDNKPIDSWTLGLHEMGAPVSGSRVSINSFAHEKRQVRDLTETVFLVEVPAQPAGTQVTISGLFKADDKTDLGSMRLIVTD